MNSEKKKVIQPIKVSERIIYIAIIAGLSLFLLLQWSGSKTLKQENHIVVQKTEVLNNYTKSLDRIIKEKETSLAHLAKSDKVQRLQIEEQIDMLHQKKEEIQQLKKTTQLDFQKLIRISAELEQMHQKDKALQARFASFEDSVNHRSTVKRQEHQNLQVEYNQLQQQLEQALETNGALSGQVYATHFIVHPGEIKQGRFSPSTRARRTTQLKIAFKLTRVLKPGERLASEVYNAQSMFPVKQVYRNELNIHTGNQVTMNLAPLGSKKFRKGNNTLNIYRVLNGKKTKVGSHVFYLR